MKLKHALLMVFACIIPLALFLGAAYFLGADQNILFFALFLICPITHLILMREMHKQ